MKLMLLSSPGLDEHGVRLRRLAGEGTRAGMVFNALDQYETRRRQLPVEAEALNRLGFQCEEVDLREYFEDNPGLTQRLELLDLLWVLGGNTFVLARAMALSGFRHAAEGLLTEGRLVYAGYSAGACVTGPDLTGMELMDDPSSIGAGHPPGAPADALGWVPWRIVPHWESDYGDSPQAVAERLRERDLPFRTLRDGEVILLD